MSRWDNVQKASMPASNKSVAILPSSWIKVSLARIFS